MLKGEEVAKWRKKLGMAQTELARRLGVTRQTVHAFETGKYKLSAENHETLTKIMGRDVPTTEKLIFDLLTWMADQIISTEISRKQKIKLIQNFEKSLRQRLIEFGWLK